MPEPQSPFTVHCGDYAIACTTSGLPPQYDAFRAHAALVDDHAVDDDSRCCVWITRRDEAWPVLVVTASAYLAGGSGVGALLVPETQILFLGAGERVLAYQLEPLARLWNDTADTGFWGWQRHGDVVVMSAELELAAWEISGRKLWSTFVEPPWSYVVLADTVELDVMGTETRFALRTGPAH